MSRQTTSQPPAADSLNDAYGQLRRIANRLMSRERAGHTLCATEVVHEAIARLLEGGWSPGGEPLPNGGRAFVLFVAQAARAMTEVLVDHARFRGAVKRGGGRRVRVS